MEGIDFHRLSTFFFEENPTRNFEERHVSRRLFSNPGQQRPLSVLMMGAVVMMLLCFFNREVEFYIFPCPYHQFHVWLPMLCGRVPGC